MAEDASRPSRLKFYLYLLALRHPRLASLLANRGQNFLTVPDADLGSLDRWRRLEGLDEMAHYAVIAGYLVRLAPGGSILDVGCGQGLLAQYIAPFVGRYLGIDRDEPCIKAAKESGVENAVFEVADAHSYAPASAFDAIVFNESLWYLRDPLNILRRYADCLTPNGVVVVSLAAFRPALQLIHMTRSVCEFVDQTIVMNDLGVVWAVQALRRKRPAAQKKT